MSGHPGIGRYQNLSPFFGSREATIVQIFILNHGTSKSDRGFDNLAYESGLMGRGTGSLEICLCHLRMVCATLDGSESSAA